MMGRQTIIALAVAIVLGLVAVYLANSYLVASQKTVEQGGTSKIAVAAVPMAFGVDVTPEKIRFVDYPNSSIPPGSFRDLAQLLPDGKRRVALLPISVNEPILTSKLSAAGTGASIAALLPDGMRAATVRINDVSGVAGFVQPNDTVDVLITRTLPGGDRATQATDVLLQNIRVIAIDQNAKNAEGTPTLARTATLEVTPLDAQKLALAQEVGSLSLVLRKPGEANNPVVETISLGDLRYNIYGGARYAGNGPAATLPQAIVGAFGRAASQISMGSSSSRTVTRTTTRTRKPAAPKGNDVEVVRGTQGNKYTVGGYGK
ncbi:MAG: Flp pilus assembly protein CpaB [Sphingomicrobium sp.]